METQPNQLDSLFQQVQKINTKYRDWDESYLATRTRLARCQKRLNTAQDELEQFRDLQQYLAERRELAEQEPPAEDLFEWEKYDARKDVLDKGIKSLTSRCGKKSGYSLEAGARLCRLQRNGAYQEILGLLSQVDDNWKQGWRLISRISAHSQYITYRPDGLDVVEALRPTYGWLEEHRPITCPEKTWDEVFNKTQEIVYPIGQQQYQYSKFWNYRVYLYLCLVTFGGYWMGGTILLIAYLLMGLNHYTWKNDGAGLPSVCRKLYLPLRVPLLWVQDDWRKAILPEMRRTIPIIYGRVTHNMVSFALGMLSLGALVVGLGGRLAILVIINWLILWCCEQNQIGSRCEKFFWKLFSLSKRKSS